MVNKDVISKIQIINYYNKIRFPYVAAEMLASESDYVLESFFPKSNENLEEIDDYYNELLTEEGTDKNKYDTFNIKYADNDNLNEDIEEVIEIVDEPKEDDEN